MKFEYAEITGKGWEGRINLFFGGYIIAMVNDIDVAREIKSAIDKYGSLDSIGGFTCAVCGGVGFEPSGAWPPLPCGVCGQVWVKPEAANADKLNCADYKDGQPCAHPGCLNHVTHPCEGCGRVAGRSK